MQKGFRVKVPAAAYRQLLFLSVCRCKHLNLLKVLNGQKMDVAQSKLEDSHALFPDLGLSCLDSVCKFSCACLVSYHEAEVDFQQCHQCLRGHPVIDYHQLGMSYELFECEASLQLRIYLFVSALFSVLILSKSSSLSEASAKLMIAHLPMYLKLTQFWSYLTYGKKHFFYKEYAMIKVSDFYPLSINIIITN